MSRAAYRVAEVAGMLGVSESTVRRWIADGDLPYVSRGHIILVPSQSVTALLGLPDGASLAWGGVGVSAEVRRDVAGAGRAARSHMEGLAPW